MFPRRQGLAAHQSVAGNRNLYAAESFTAADPSGSPLPTLSKSIGTPIHASWREIQDSNSARRLDPLDGTYRNAM